MTDDERFGQFVREAAADYEAPRGETPREAMWSAIRERRTAARPSRAEEPAVRPRRAPHSRMWIGMAATLLLGVAVGRFAWQHDRAAVVVNAPSSALSKVAPPAEPTPSGQRTLAPAATPPFKPAAHASPHDGGTRRDSRAMSYTVATSRHLENVEALLTSVAANAAEARTDSLMAGWARELLSNTRLLLDSPAARDPMRARLLQDLEVILVQLVQRSPRGNAEERSSLERTLNRTQIIPRLRSAVPASLHSGTD